MKKTSMEFDPEFHKKLKILAIEEGLSMVQLIEKAVLQYKKGVGRGGN